MKSGTPYKATLAATGGTAPYVCGPLHKGLCPPDGHRFVLGLLVGLGQEPGPFEIQLPFESRSRGPHIVRHFLECDLLRLDRRVDHHGLGSFRHDFVSLSCFPSLPKEGESKAFTRSECGEIIPAGW